MEAAARAKRARCVSKRRSPADAATRRPVRFYERYRTMAASFQSVLAPLVLRGCCSEQHLKLTAYRRTYDVLPMETWLFTVRRAAAEIDISWWSSTRSCSKLNFRRVASEPSRPRMPLYVRLHETAGSADGHGPSIFLDPYSQSALPAVPIRTMCARPQLHCRACIQMRIAAAACGRGRPSRWMSQSKLRCKATGADAE